MFEFLDSGRKCISVRCLIRLLGISSHVAWLIRPLYTTPCKYHTTWHGPVDWRLFFLIVYIVVLNSM